MSKIRIGITLLIVGLMTMPFSTARSQSTGRPERTASWEFQTLDGDCSPFDDASTKAIVLTFISTDCPIANSYHPFLKQLDQRFHDAGFRFLLVHSKADIDASAARRHAKEFQLKMPVVLDADQTIARRVNATVTPEVVVVVRDQAEPIYRGRIDNLFEDYGKKRKEPTEHYLVDALQQIQQGQPVSISNTKPIGCFISFADTKELAATQSVLANQQESAAASGTKSEYDPLKIPENKTATGKSKSEQLAAPKSWLATIKDTNRNREIPIKVYLPADAEAAPVVLFSHGLGGSRENGTYLANHWTQRGYVCVYLQHPGSDESVWKDVRAGQRITAMQTAANMENLQLRAGDVPVVLDQLTIWNQQTGHKLFGRLNLSKIGMSGHSFGAVTTQAVSGQKYLGTQRFLEDRITASIAFSPSAPRAGSAKAAFENIKLPWMSMTGTKDVSMIGGADVESRLNVFASLTAGNKYQLVLKDGEHSAFADGGGPTMARFSKQNPNHHVLVKAYSTAFWDAYLKDDLAAQQWLNSERCEKLLEAGDEWSKK